MRYAIISDIHANLAALEAVLNHMGPVDSIWCLGDIVGYGPDPNECVELVRQKAQVCIPGNHDWACCGKIDTVDFNPAAAAACRWTQRQLLAHNRDYLAALPLTHLEDEFTLAHGSPLDPIWEYIASIRSARENFAGFHTHYCFVGHTHVPIIFLEEPGSLPRIRVISPQQGQPFPLGESRLIINPGSVGQPRDGNPAASYMILDLAANVVEYYRVPYDIERTQAKMLTAGLPPQLIMRLTYGW